MEGLGHNSLHPAAVEKLKSFISRVENVEEEIKDLQEVRKDVYSEAKAMGFDTKAIRKIVQLRKIDKHEREEQEMILDTYESALDGFM